MYKSLADSSGPGAGGLESAGHGPSSRLGDKARTAVGWMSAAYLLVWILLLAMRYYGAQEDQTDVGVFAQSLYNTLHGQGFMFNTPEQMSHFGVHFSPFLLLLLPYYALAPHPLLLHLLVPLAIVLGAWLFAALLIRLGLVKETPYLVGLYFLYHPLHGVDYDSFYTISLCLPAIFATFLAWENRSRAAFFTCLIVLVSMRQDLAFFVFGWGLYLLVFPYPTREEARRWRVVGAWLLLLAPLYLLVTIRFVQPLWNTGHASLLRHLGSLYGGTNPLGLLASVLFHPLQVISNVLSPKKWIGIAELLLPLGFLPVLRPRALLVAAPYAGLYLLMDASTRFPTGDHYVAPLIPVLFVTLAQSIHAGWPAGARVPVLRRVTWLCLLCTLFLNPSPLRIGWKHIALPAPSNATVWRFVAMVPPSDSVATQGSFFPWVCHRHNAYARFQAGVKWVLVDRGREKTFREAGYDQVWSELLRQYDVVSAADQVYLLRRRPEKDAGPERNGAGGRDASGSETP